jgi:hypothetical protein
MTIIACPLLVFLSMAADAPPEPKRAVGKDTTVATGPFDKDGYIDYETALNERIGKGIKPETNANALLWKAVGPRPEGGRMPAEFFKQLGIEEPPEKGEYFIPLHRFMMDNLKLQQREFESIFDQQSRAAARPWTAADYPHIAAWLFINEKPLALVVEATKKPDYFNPMASRREKKGPSNLIGCLLPHVQRCRELATTLCARAMQRVAEGKVDEAWQDLMACHRLARLVGHGPSLIESLVGIAIDAIVSNAELAYLERAKLTTKQIQERLKDLQALPAFPPMADKIDLMERFCYLDCTQMIRRGGIKALEGLSDGSIPPEAKGGRAQQNLELLDWDEVMRNGNKRYDRLAAAIRIGDRAQREKELDKLDDELKAQKRDLTDSGALARLLLGGPPDKAAAKTMSDVLIALLLPAVRKVQSAYDRSAQIQRNLQVAFAMAAYHKDNGRYPAKLDDLAPKYLAAVPGDIFSGKAIIYKPAKNGYLFYSVGINGKDDEGRWYDDDPPGDDPRVRMPLPDLKPRK